MAKETSKIRNVTQKNTSINLGNGINPFQLRKRKAQIQLTKKKVGLFNGKIKKYRN